MNKKIAHWATMAGFALGVGGGFPQTTNYPKQWNRAQWRKKKKARKLAKANRRRNR